MVFVRRKEVNEVLRGLIEIGSGADYVNLSIEGMEELGPQESLAVLRFLRRFCKVSELVKGDHPLGRGYIVFSCPQFEVRVHGDWTPEGNYVKVSKW